MLRECCQCNKFLGSKEPHEDTRVTHTLCPRCMVEQHLTELGSHLGQLLFELTLNGRKAAEIAVSEIWDLEPQEWENFWQHQLGELGRGYKLALV